MIADATTAETTDPAATDTPYTLITADTHAGGSIAQYRTYLEERYHAAFDEWRAAHHSHTENRDRTSTRKQRNWDHEIRTEDQNSQGVVAEVVFPNTVPPFYPKTIVTARPPTADEYELRLAGIRAHNRWLADFCAEAPHRRAGIGLILPNDFDDAIADIEFIAGAGLRGGVLLPLVPPDCTWVPQLHDPAWDRVFAAIQDHDLVMNQHSGQGLPDYGTGLVAEAMWVSVRASTIPGRSAAAARRDPQRLPVLPVPRRQDGDDLDLRRSALAGWASRLAPTSGRRRY